MVWVCIEFVFRFEFVLGFVNRFVNGFVNRFVNGLGTILSFNLSLKHILNGKYKSNPKLKHKFKCKHKIFTKKKEHSNIQMPIYKNKPKPNLKPTHKLNFEIFSNFFFYSKIGLSTINTRKTHVKLNITCFLRFWNRYRCHIRDIK